MISCTFMCLSPMILRLRNALYLLCIRFQRLYITLFFVCHMLIGTRTLQILTTLFGWHHDLLIYLIAFKVRTPLVVKLVCKRGTPWDFTHRWWPPCCTWSLAAVAPWCSAWAHCRNPRRGCWSQNRSCPWRSWDPWGICTDNTWWPMLK